MGWAKQGSCLGQGKILSVLPMPILGISADSGAPSTPAVMMHWENIRSPRDASLLVYSWENVAPGLKYLPKQPRADEGFLTGSQLPAGAPRPLLPEPWGCA